MRVPRMRRHGIRHSVFLSQLVMAVCVLMLVVLLLVLNVGFFTQQTFFLGVIIVFALTALSASIDWSRLPLWSIAVIPILDIIAVTLMRIDQPSIAVPFFYIFPVIWLASYFDRSGAVVGAGLSSVLYIAVVVAETHFFGPDDVPRILVIPITLAFVATATYRSTARNRAQRVILDRQSGLLERALERSKKGEQLLDEVLDALPFGVVRLNEKARFEFTNAAYRSWVGRQRHPVPGEAGYQVYSADGHTVMPESERPFVRAARGEEFSEIVVWLGEQNSEDRRAYAVTGHRVNEVDGESLGVVVVTRDVTTELEAVKARDDLMASVTHELRNPLTSVTGFVELALEDPELSPATRKHLEVVLKSSDRMLDLVTDLLDVHRARAVEIKLSKAPMELADTVLEAIEAAQGRAGGIELRVDALDAAPMFADSFRLRQVIDNLLSNAIKYNRSGGSVIVNLRVDGEARLSVSDTGRGLSPDEASQLFTKYYRAASAFDVRGTGLGLSICQDIVRRHGGDITVQSVLGEGSTFTVTLPLAEGDEGKES